MGIVLASHQLLKTGTPWVYMYIEGAKTKLSKTGGAVQIPANPVGVQGFSNYGWSMSGTVTALIPTNFKDLPSGSKQPDEGVSYKHIPGITFSIKKNIVDADGQNGAHKLPVAQGEQDQLAALYVAQFIRINKAGKFKDVPLWSITVQKDWVGSLEVVSANGPWFVYIVKTKKNWLEYVWAYAWEKGPVTFDSTVKPAQGGSCASTYLGLEPGKAPELGLAFTA